MKALSLTTPHEFQYLQLDNTIEISPNEALVKIHKIGICGTDYHAFQGKQPFFSYPRILGHELGVEVVEIGSEVDNIKVGDKCAVEPYLNCGKCWACQRDLTNCCENIQVLGVHTNGGMTEYIKIPAHKLHVSAILNYEELALVETLGIGAHAVERASVTDKDTVLVIGAGPIGLSVMEFAKLKKAKVAVLDINTHRLDFCIQHQKADFAILANEQAEENIKAAFGGNLPTVVLDATGNKQSMHNAFNYPAAGGRLVFVGLYQGDFTFFDPNFHKRELSIFASRNSKASDFTYIIKALENKQIDVNTWITHHVAFDEVAAVFTNLLTDTTLVKAVISL